MTGEALLFIFAVIAAAVLLFIMVYFIIMFSDLEVDYINPIDLCNKLNMVSVSDARMPIASHIPQKFYFDEGGKCVVLTVPRSHRLSSQSTACMPSFASYFCSPSKSYAF